MGRSEIITLHEREDSEGDEYDLPPSRIEFETKVVTDSWAAGQRHYISFLLKPVDMESLIDKLLTLEGDNPILNLRSVRLWALLDNIVTPKGITLPTAAIHREHIIGFFDVILEEHHYVFIYIDGRVEKRNINVGTIIGDYVQIITGIDEDAKVVILR
jgi:hypothetical protein